MAPTSICISVDPENDHNADDSIAAWLQVPGGFLAMLNTWGIVYSYGIFQAYYEKGYEIIATPSEIAWIGSTQASLLLLVGGLCGRFFDAGYLRTLILLGSSLIVLGFMMASLASKYWQLILAQGVCVGFGMGCLLVPSVATVGTWFAKRRGVAFGIVSSGGAFGGIMLPLVLQKLLDEYGFEWTMRAQGFLSLLTLLMCSAFLRQRLRPSTATASFEWHALREMKFSLFITGYLLVCMGLYVFPQFVQSWAEATEFSSRFPPSMYLPILYAASIPGRVLISSAADRFGPMNLQIPCILASALLIFVWLQVKSLAGIMVVVVLYGFLSGALLALPLSVLAQLTTNPAQMGARMGIFFVFEAFGTLIGTPIAGAIIGKDDVGGHWSAMRFWGGAMVLAGGGLTCCSRWKASSERRAM